MTTVLLVDVVFIPGIKLTNSPDTREYML